MAEGARDGAGGPAAGCPFCELLDTPGHPAVVERWPDAVALTPRGPVTEGHVLVVPRRHVADAAADPEVAAAAMRHAARLAGRYPSCNIITSCGAEATQTVFHLHLHVVPRRDGDRLALPWVPAPR
ncbi:HIT family protein [Streptomyces sp. NRRL F-5123]|uniref:HIT family protein n=1 Tax=Streptomyces sp. NRRL F-5123 TaxID=1463856 RepID=UPI00099D0810|nr:HIT family protein [Streptomyces sp. NRRL F-5123]